MGNNGKTTSGGIPVNINTKSIFVSERGNRQIAVSDPQFLPMIVFLIMVLIPCEAQTTFPEVSQAEIREPIQAELILQKANYLIASGKEDEAADELEMNIPTASDPMKLKTFLSDLLASQAVRFMQGRRPQELQANQAEKVLKQLRRAKNVSPEKITFWKLYLGFLIEFPEKNEELGIEGQTFLDFHGTHVGRDQIPEWIPIFRKLEKTFEIKDLPIARLEILQLMMLDIQNASDVARIIPVVTEVAKARLKDFIEKIEAKIVIGDAFAAEAQIARLKKIEPHHPKINELVQKLEKIKKIQTLSASIFSTFRQKNFEKVKEQCREILKLDPNNSIAKSYLSQLESMNKQPAISSSVLDKQRLAKIQKDLTIKLEAAESAEELRKTRDILIELISLGLGNDENIKRLRDVDQELSNGRLRTTEDWDRAKVLFKDENWHELRRLLNRNPAIGESLDRMLTIAEMSLVADLNLGLKSDEEISINADRLASKNPKSFWVSIVRLKIALKRSNYDEAQMYLEQASIINPNHDALKWPRTLIFVRKHGWKFVPIILLLFFYALAKSMHPISAWWEKFYWTRVSWYSRLFPRLALSSLEKRFGSAKEIEEKVLLYELLAKSAFRSGNFIKGVRYAEVLLEVEPANPLAKELLGKHYLSEPKIDEKGLDYTVFFIQNHPEDKSSLQKLVKHVISTDTVQPNLANVFKRYLGLFPKDDEAMVFFGRICQSAKPEEIGQSGIEILEKGWRISGKSEILIGLVRAYFGFGLFEEAVNILSESLEKGSNIDGYKLFEIFENDMELSLRSIIGDIDSLDRAASTSAMKKIIELRSIPDLQGNSILSTLSGLVNEEDPVIRYLVQKARNHVKTLLNKCSEIKESLAILFPQKPNLPIQTEPLLQETTEQTIDQEQQTQGEQQIITVSATESPDMSNLDKIFTQEKPIVEKSSMDDQVPPTPVEMQEPPTMTELPAFPKSPNQAELPKAQKEIRNQDDSWNNTPEITIASIPESMTAASDFRLPSTEELPKQIDEKPESLPEPIIENAIVAEEEQKTDLLVEKIETIEKEPLENISDDSPDVPEIHIMGPIQSTSERITSLPDDPQDYLIEELIGISTPTHMPDWIAYLNKPLPATTLEMLVKKLGKLRSPEIALELVKFLDHKVPRVCANALEGLQDSQDASVIPYIIPMIRNQDNRIRANAIRALAAFGVESIMDEVRKMAEDPQIHMRDSATYVLRGIKGSEAAALLNKLLHDSESVVRRNAIASLVYQGDPSNRDVLAAFYESNDDPIERKLIKKALEYIDKKNVS